LERLECAFLSELDLTGLLKNRFKLPRSDLTPDLLSVELTIEGRSAFGGQSASKSRMEAEGGKRSYKEDVFTPGFCERLTRNYELALEKYGHFIFLPRK
jgi:hypothetical protein